MKPKITILLLFLCLFSSLWGSKGNENLLKKLDKKIETRHERFTQTQAHIDKLKKNIIHQNLEEKYQTTEQLFEIYSYYQIDSAIVYNNLKQKIAQQLENKSYQLKTLIEKATIMSYMGMAHEALEILSTIEKDNLEINLKLSYLRSQAIAYQFLYSNASITSIKKHYSSLQEKCIKEYFSYNYLQHSEYIYMMVDKYFSENKYEEMIKFINQELKNCTDLRKIGRLRSSSSACYKELGNPELEEYNIILSAIADLDQSVREYIALQKLAVFLYEKGDIERAYKYMTCSMEDAISCNATTRIIAISQIYPLIQQAYKMQENREDFIIRIAVIFLTLLAFLLFSAVLYVYKQMKKLTKARRELAFANQRLSTINKTLKETNKIKEEYIAQYLTQCSLYIEKLDSYRKQLAKLAMSSKLEELFKKIKSTDLIEQEKKNFYRQFDETFLGLFPHFVESFNDLLKEEAHIKPKSNELLSTDIRIFALIRLGITDSARISKFLRSSMSTVYNYRSKIRNMAKHDKEHFEEEVMHIGETSVNKHKRPD